MNASIRPFAELEPGDSADFFVLIAASERATTRDGKPYFRLTLRDASRSATMMVWSDSDWFPACEQNWRIGEFLKIRGRYLETKFGAQVEAEQVRLVVEQDRQDGFDPAEFYETSRRDPQEMLEEMKSLATSEITDLTLRELVLRLLARHETMLLSLPAATRNHHAFTGGFLEHVLSVTKTAIWLADKYRSEYPSLDPPLSKSLVVAGAMLHDIGKVVELSHLPPLTDYTPEGRLIGHILLGRDLVRDAAREIPDFDRETLLRLEHIIVSHQNLPEWGSPVSPHTPEALLVHYSDDMDAKFQMMVAALKEKPRDGDCFTSKQNPLRRRIFRGFAENETQS